MSIAETDIREGLDKIEAMWGQGFKSKPQIIGELTEACENAGMDRYQWLHLIAGIISDNANEPFKPKPVSILMKISGRYAESDETWKNLRCCTHCVDGLRICVDTVNDQTFALWCDCEKATKHPQYKTLPLHKLKYISDLAQRNPARWLVLDYSECWAPAEIQPAAVPF